MFFQGGLRAFVAVAITAAPLAAEPPRIPPDQLAHAIRTDGVTIPSPGELFAALEKPGKPNWAAQYRGPLPMTYSNRAQIALNLGGLVADGFIAVEAQDGQQVKNIGTDIVKLAKALGVSERVLSRGNSINEFAEHSEWSSLQEELEATQNEVKTSMQSHSDQDLVILVSLGGWIRGTQVVTASLLQNFDEHNAAVLRQPALVNFIHSKINDISPELQKDALIKLVGDQLGNLEKLVAFAPGKAPSIDEVRRLNEAVTSLMGEIQNKADAK